MWKQNWNPTVLTMTFACLGGILFQGRWALAEEKETAEKIVEEAVKKLEEKNSKVMDIPERNEIVMPPDMKITATTPSGTLTITAGKGLERSYTWDGGTRSVKMWPREDRWNGSLGLYYPGPGEHWIEHKGITRGVVEEGQQHFPTVEEALKFISNRKWMAYVFSNDGLVVGWSKEPARKQLNVEVWQIYIAGKKPVKLDGSQDEKIVVVLPKKIEDSKTSSNSDTTDKKDGK